MSVQIPEFITLSWPEGEAIRGNFMPTTSTQFSPALIFAHGLGSTRQGEKAQALQVECARRGWAFAAFDFRGHGDSEGTMLELRGARLLADLDAIVHFVAERGHQTIFLVGSSMGGWASAWWAALHPQRITACALIAPALRFLEWQRLSEAERAQWQQTGRLRITNQWIDVELGYGLYTEAEQYQFASLTQQLLTPSLLLHGMRDDTVPYAQSYELIEQCAAAEMQLLLIKNGDHRLNMHKEMMARVICDFFQHRYSGLSGSSS
jgi:uncharacterized protein